MVLKTYELNKSINLSLLDTQIFDSGAINNFGGLSTYENFLDVLGDSMDEVLLDLVIFNHSYTPLPVYKLTNNLEDVSNIDYNVFGLHKKFYFNQGALSLTEYYKNCDGINYTDLVVKESRTYFRDGNNLVQYREQLTSWYMTDESIGLTKTTIKYYNIQDSINESEVRRANLIGDCQLYTLFSIGIENCWDFIESINAEISLYVKGATQFLKDKIQASTKPYIDQNLKNALVYILTIN